MLVIPVKDGENIDRALKRFKRKFIKTGTLKQLRARKQYIKKSERLRIKNQKAVYSEALLRDSE
ncbi:MAG: 30S ribosomal protein S21 [Flavobacteriales bacterium]|jgi:small subunit ribosomal protein S21|nr:30S ribosomal protein S21 [Flavobacteriales bacterium]MBT3612676.1 30S ribosomal protein S21 [Flavobacteriales bacterium]MBT5090065.1 30S ribosomal protein S21 [Flavobacteriales bacterium]MBT5749745.1 30S ribosomal protein S21 [Flavobacteriales bacterium]|tara:strand:- start:153 stop:344 length:192 start_codon:yes stop_codon:yes gene_type:complete